MFIRFIFIFQVKIDPKSVNFSTLVFPYDHLVFHVMEKRNNKLIFQESTLVSVRSLVMFSNSDFQLESGNSNIYLEKGTIQLNTGSCQVRLQRYLVVREEWFRSHTDVMIYVNT